jgi:glycosyltransferase involved in cell wall biosynthesis/peptidoglycan/xylan/chitin deacetylase (PgdA/CDA1 family)
MMMNKVIVTTSWDDGHKSDLKTAKLLKKYGFTGTFYVSPESRELRPEEKLSEEDLRSMAEDFEIGAHTMTHPRLDRISATEAKNEIVDSKQALEKIIGKPVTSFCYPYGGYNSRVKQIVKETGFTFARSIDRFATDNIDRFAAKTSVDTFDHMRDGMWSVLHLCGKKPWRIFKLRRWDNLAKEMFLKAQKENGVFHLWGHSHDIELHNDWDRLEKLIAFIAKQDNVCFAKNSELPINRPKVLVAAPYFGQDLGGLEKYAFQITSGLQKDYGWDAVVVTSGESDLKMTKMEYYEGIKVYHMPNTLKISNTPASLSWHRQIKRIIAIEKPDIVNAHMPVPGIADIVSFAAGKIPIVVTYHMSSMKKGRWQTDFLIKLYESIFLRFTLVKAQAIICPSEFVKTGFLNKYFPKISVISPGVDIDSFRPARADSKYNLMHVGGLKKGEKHKGLIRSLEAVADLKSKYPEVHLNVVGRGNDAGYYQELSAKMGIEKNVTFCGLLGPQEMVSIYQKTNVFIAPASKESFGMAIVEAMACGLPVVANKAEGIPYIIQDGKNGYLVEAGKINQIAEKIDFLFQHPDTAKIIGETARNSVVDNYQWNNKVTETNIHLLRILKLETEKPKLIMVTPYFYPKVGGLENYAYNIARRLRKNGNYDVSVITSNDSSRNFAREIIEGMNIYRLPTWFKLSNTPISPLWYWQIKHIFKFERPSIIHLHAPVPYISDIAALAAGKTPTILTYHAGSMIKGKRPVDILIYIYENIFLYKLYKSVDAIVSVSQKFERSRYGNLFAYKTQLIPPGVDTKRYTFTPLPDGTKIVTFVGRVELSSKWKGISFLLRAMSLVIKNIPDAKLEIIGGGDAVRYYQKQIDALGIAESVRMLGYQTDQDLIDAYRRSSVVVLPSTSEAESFGTVLIEAMASGRPVIGSNIGGIVFVIDHQKNGLLVPPKNPEALAKAIKIILENDEMKKTFADNGVIKAKTFDWELQTEKYQELYQKLLDDKPIL